MERQQGQLEQLDLERAAARAQVAALEEQVADIVAATESANSDDEHDPEGATIAFERAALLSLLDRARERESEATSALGRAEAGSYGVCEGCGGPIGDLRLAARPSARTCIACATATGS